MVSAYKGHKLQTNIETGFFKLLEKESKIELSVCHKQSICEISEGTVTEKEVVLSASHITRTNSAEKECNLFESIKRKYWMEEGQMKYEIVMTTLDNNEHKFEG